MTEELVTWLTEQIDEDEYAAKREPEPDPLSGIITQAPDGRPIYAHPTRWSPARALAECDAKRQVIAEHGLIYRDIGFLEVDEGELVDATEELPVCGRCVPKHASFNRREDIPVGPCRTVRLLALPLADRPGYREEWRP